jgi:hypothetical protein
MRFPSLILAAALFVVGTPVVARGQYPQLPAASATTSITSTNPSAMKVCTNAGASSSLAEAITIGVDCTFGAGTVGNNVDQLFHNPLPGTSTFDAGNFATHAKGTSTPATNSVVATSSGNGLLHVGMRADGNSEASQYFYVTIADPTSVFRIALSSASTLGATVSPLNGESFQARNAVADAVTNLVSFTVDQDKNVVDFTRALFKESISDTQQGAYVSTQYCPDGSNCAYVDNSVTGFDLSGSTLNADGVFGFYLRSATRFTQRNSSGGDYTGTEMASAQLDAPSILLYDAAGNQIFNAITIDRGLAVVTSTPEPASVVLLATGLVGVCGAARRRRRGTAA